MAGSAQQAMQLNQSASQTQTAITSPALAAYATLSTLGLGGFAQAFTNSVNHHGGMNALNSSLGNLRNFAELGLEMAKMYMKNLSASIDESSAIPG